MEVLGVGGTVAALDLDNLQVEVDGTGAVLDLDTHQVAVDMGPACDREEDLQGDRQNSYCRLC